MVHSILWRSLFMKPIIKSTICLITIFVWTFGWDFNLFISLIFYKWWAIRQYRESSSVQSFLSTSADHRTRSTHLSREKPIVLKKKKRYSMRSRTGLMNRSHVREAVSRQRWSMPKTGKTRWWHILRMDTAVFPITYVRMSYVHLQLEGKTGCSVQLQKVPLPVHWSIQWLRWQKPMSLTFINAWHIFWSIVQVKIC